MPHKERAHIHVAVLAGGTSSERDISLNSGAHAQAALKEAGYDSVVLLDTADTAFLTTLLAGGFDVCFLALHGTGGEDGVIQGLLEFLGLPYTGSGVCASACAADKDLSKLLYSDAGIPIAPGLSFTKERVPSIEEIQRVVGQESFVKPAINGSSYGITLVKDPAELARAIEKAFMYSDKVLVEQRVRGTEVTVGIFEDRTGPHALPAVEVCIENEGAEFYDSRVKYIDPQKIHRIPAHIPAEAYVHVQRLAVLAHQALGCRGFSRSDFIISDAGPVILETNTIPGMTTTSLYPDEVRHTETLTFPEVCASLVDCALECAAH